MPQDVIEDEDLDYYDLHPDEYDGGDEVTVTVRGTIESEEDSPLSGYKYLYYFSDNSIRIFSKQDLGNEGDTVTIECKVASVEIVGYGSTDMLVVEHRVMDPPFLLGSFAITMILFALVIHLACTKYRERPTQPQQTPQIPLQYQMPSEKNTAGLILGILSIAFFWFFGLGAVLGIEGFMISRPKSKVRAKYGLGGMILSIIGVIVGIIFTFIVIRGILFTVYG